MTSLRSSSDLYKFLSINKQLLAGLQQRAAIHETAGNASSMLYYDEVTATASGGAAATTGGAQAPKTICVLHGLLGTGRNLKGVVTDLCRQAAEQTGVSWRALLLDLRNHGKSARVASLHPPHSLSAAAHDVVRVWQQALGGRPPEVLVGHSMGGKTALEVVRQLALPNAPQMGQPKHVWVLDARPTAVHSSSSGGGGGGVDAPTQDVLNVLEAVRSVPLPLASRQALYEHLGARGLSTALQQWLGSSLTPDGQQQGGLVWTFNVEGAAQMFDDYCRLDYSQLLRAPPRGVTLHILRALRSDRWDHDTLALVRGAAAGTAQPAALRGQTRYHELADAGHWVHSDNPKGLVKLMLPSLQEAAR